jgi:hypothetical protein
MPFFRNCADARNDENGSPRVSSFGEDLREISDRCAALPNLDLRTPEEIIGFDEHGLPAGRDRCPALIAALTTRARARLSV